MNVDPKEKWLITQLHSSISSGFFNERDVLALLILLRGHAAKNTPIRELSDFIAHRRKDRGVLKTFLERVQKILLNQVVGDVILPVFGTEAIRNSFNDLFNALGLPEFSDETSNQVTICIISLLQSVRVKTNTNQPIRNFAIGVSSQHIGLFGQGSVPAGHVIAFPMLLARNTYPELAGVDGFMILDRIVETQSINGKICVAHGNALSAITLQAGKEANG